MRVPALDKELGMDVYVTDTEGIGGIIRKTPSHFVVEEILVDGSVASTEEVKSYSALGASLLKNHYLLCILVKRRWDTFEAVRNIAKQLGISQTGIQIAGIKDANAITAQHITIENVSPEDVEKVDIKDIEIRPIGYFRDELSQFYLLGNHFIVSANDIEYSESIVKHRIEKVVEELAVEWGIPNFFGHQRFGTTRAITHLVGKAIVKRDFREGVMLFLAEPSSYEHPESRLAREELKKNQDFKRALQNFPIQLRFERRMLHHLVGSPTDFVGAYRQLPIKLQKLFVQAYQSYLFNRFLSERVRNGIPMNVAEVGDYVVSVERCGLPMSETGKLVTANSKAEINNSIESGKARVALPLVGFNRRLSEGEMGRIEENIIEDQGIELLHFKVQEINDISAKGHLRPAVSPLLDFKLESISCNNERLRHSQAKMSFTLLRGSYATILLREIIKPRNPVESGF